MLQSNPTITPSAGGLLRALPLACALGTLCWAFLAAFAYGVYLLAA
jgi:hypothetical protein